MNISSPSELNAVALFAEPQTLEGAAVELFATAVVSGTEAQPESSNESKQDSDTQTESAVAHSQLAVSQLAARLCHLPRSREQGDRQARIPLNIPYRSVEGNAKPTHAVSFEVVHVSGHHNFVEQLIFTPDSVPTVTNGPRATVHSIAVFCVTTPPELLSSADIDDVYERFRSRLVLCRALSMRVVFVCDARPTKSTAESEAASNSEAANAASKVLLAVAQRAGLCAPNAVAIVHVGIRSPHSLPKVLSALVSNLHATQERLHAATFDRKTQAMFAVDFTVAPPPGNHTNATATHMVVGYVVKGCVQIGSLFAPPSPPSAPLSCTVPSEALRGGLGGTASSGTSAPTPGIGAVRVLDVYTREAALVSAGFYTHMSLAPAHAEPSPATTSRGQFVSERLWRGDILFGLDGHSAVPQCTSHFLAVVSLSRSSLRLGDRVFLQRHPLESRRMQSQLQSSTQLQIQPSISSVWHRRQKPPAC